MVYTEVGTHDLLIADLLGSPHQRIFGGYALWPQWSPDGTKIAFTSQNATGTYIATIKPNGTQFRVIVSPTSTWWVYRPYWSPGSNFIAFTGQDGSPVNLDVWRVTATGSNLTDLTNRPAPFNESIVHTFGGGGWR